jgi:CubicO group peptidase (beta-lactamase class C family)
VTRRATLWVIAAVALCAMAGVWRWRALQEVHVAGVLVAGGDGGGLPRTTPELEGFDASALHAVAAGALKRGTNALLILRHGHLVYEGYAGGADASTRVEGGDLARSLLVMAAGVAVAQYGMIMPAPPLSPDRLAAAIVSASGRSYPAFLSRHIWQPLHAAPAYWSPPEVSARGADWLRVGELLLHDGRFEGTQIVQPGWIVRHSSALFGPDTASPAGAELLSLHGSGATRLWLAPRPDIAILRVAATPPPGVAVDETLARTIINTLRDHPASGGSSLNDLVPGH